MKGNYDLMEELGHWAGFRDEDDIWASIKDKIASDQPLSQMEATWLAWKAELLKCDCESCVARSKTMIDKHDQDHLDAHVLEGDRDPLEWLKKRAELLEERAQELQDALVEFCDAYQREYQRSIYHDLDHVEDAIATAYENACRLLSRLT